MRRVALLLVLVLADLVERFEDVLEQLLRDADPGVADHDDQHTVAMVGDQPDLAALGELHRVAEQVHVDLAQALLVDLDRGRQVGATAVDRGGPSARR